MKVLVVVDMQNDFISGSLGSEQAKAIVPVVASKIVAAHESGTIVITTRDQHGEGYMDSQEGRKLPVEHCMVGEWGFELDPAIKDVIDHDGDYGIEKPTFGSFDLVNLMFSLEEADAEADEPNTITDIEVCGLCTDICVAANAVLLKTAFPEANLNIDANAVAGSTVENHEAALTTLKCLQVNVING